MIIIPHYREFVTRKGASNYGFCLRLILYRDARSPVYVSPCMAMQDARLALRIRVHLKSFNIGFPQANPPTRWFASSLWSPVPGSNSVFSFLTLGCGFGYLFHNSPLFFEQGDTGFPDPIGMLRRKGSFLFVIIHYAFAHFVNVVVLMALEHAQDGLQRFLGVFG